MTSSRQAGRLVPETAKGLRGGCVVLRPGEAMPWHSTRDREELLIALRGVVQVELRRRVRRRTLRAGRCLFLPARTAHRVINRSRRSATYLYVTGPVAS